MAKVFQIFVSDDKLVSRIISCENQVTELFVIDRSDKDFISKYEKELKSPALYILINRDLKQLYVGETDNSYKRLKDHEAKDFWTEAIVFHSTNNTLSTTEVKWLEAKTYEILAELGYYDLSHNKQTPQYPNLKRNQIYTLEPIFGEAKTYICAAGFDIFLRSNTNENNQQNKENKSDESQKAQEDKPYLTAKNNTPGYYSAVRSNFIKDVLKQLNMPENIFDITDLNVLEMIRKEVAKKEKNKGSHNQYACSISQLKHYIENGLTYKEFEHDAMLVKRIKKENKKKN